VSLPRQKTLLQSYKEENITITKTVFLAIYGGIAFKLENFGPIFSSFNPSPSLPSVAIDDRKQFQCLIIVLNNKTGPLFLEFKTRVSFKKE